MNDKTIKTLAELQEEYEAASDDYLKSSAEHRNEVRRHLDIRTSFYDKLSALDAASIAVAVSIGIAMIAKSELRPGSLHANATWLVGIVVSLWVSLVCAVVHNFVVVSIAKLDSASQKADLDKVGTHLWATKMRVERPADPKADLTWEQRIEQKQWLRQEKILKRIMLLYRCVPPLAHISIASFLAAYTVVVVCVVRLWWITR
ncbi:MAG: hypothetical protein ABR866_03380 [Candidatus Korobacteraceae bacterium]|jgi:hypothetical protein